MGASPEPARWRLAGMWSFASSKHDGLLSLLAQTSWSAGMCFSSNRFSVLPRATHLEEAANGGTGLTERGRWHHRCPFSVKIEGTCLDGFYSIYQGH